MKTYKIELEGSLTNAICVFTMKANSVEEAFEKWRTGRIEDTEITGGEFEPDDLMPDLEEFEEVKNDA